MESPRNRVTRFLAPPRRQLGQQVTILIIIVLVLTANSSPALVTACASLVLAAIGASRRRAE